MVGMLLFPFATTGPLDADKNTMSLSTTTEISASLPPEYTEDASDVQETLQPDTLRQADRFIHSANSAEADSGVYETNREIDSLRENARRGGYGGRDSTAAPEIVAHPKRVFNIERPPLVIQEPFAYYIRSVSRSGIGAIGVRFSKIGKGSICKAWLVKRKLNATSDWEAKELLFDVRINNDVCDWMDDSGGRLAVEESRDGINSLNILVPLERAMRDALVATWCVRRWECKALEYHQKRTWKESESTSLFSGPTSRTQIRP
ncbi:hypothetical protein CGLO_09928 [Colletotrichum gloeosporioides Cg-14]|uniref:Uncharacterized protein n=1 Tax=Colletotrichum gloeosporioides (strain Cg-14) TaxID=1237896 RepID=T0KCE2_COLGC|nr:hypothetical protein CGLO_09928 [Colletotrichum gloeosporioides Cg-14]